MKNLVQTTKLIAAIVFISQASLAARILNANWNTQTQSVIINMAYQGGCLPHTFSVEWDSCATDGTRFGQIIDMGASDTCNEELLKSFESQEPNDGCIATSLILKSTASKVAVVVEK